MRLEGRLKRDGAWWMVEMPALDAVTQGRSREEALEMAADWVESILGDETIDVTVHPTGEHQFEIECSDTTAIVALMLRRLRRKHGLTLAEVAQRLEVRSANTYARYERGEATPSIDTLNRLLHAVTGHDLVVRSG